MPMLRSGMKRGSKGKGRRTTKLLDVKSSSGPWVKFPKPRKTLGVPIPAIGRNVPKRKVRKGK